jgi:rubrerythrin
MTSKPISLEEALKTAIVFEEGIYGTYIDAQRKTNDPAAKKTLAVMAEEEKGHVNYLKDRLAEWRQSGKVTDKKLASILPSPEAIRQGLKSVQSKLHGTSQASQLGHSDDMRLLNSLLEAETAAHKFYADMVARLDGDGKELFRQFLASEDGHVAMVQAEIDALSGSGYWFDVAEVRFETE